jgi:hypothetical protein
MSIRILTLCTTLLALAAPAGAQQFNGWMAQSASYADDQWSYGYGGDSRRIAYDNGYREGRKDGEDDARHGRGFELEREKDYRNADHGYNRSYGDKDRYRDSFRNGYAQGYRDAYGRNGYGGGGYYGGGSARRDDGRRYPSEYPGTRYPDRYPGYGNQGYGYGLNVAFQNGVNDGYEKGLDDARKGRYPEYARQKWYREGDHNYNSRYGPREAYKDQYRRGFQQGYERAYQGTRRW